jgi:mono/diheme cytochrome c family protein
MFVAQPFRIRRFAAGLVIALAAVFSPGAFPQVKIGPTDSAVIARGLIVYKDRCAICHFSESQAKKIGPGLAGIYKRGKFTDGGKVDDASMEKWILSGGKNMPPFKPLLNAIQVRDLIAYLKTLY